MYLRTFFVTSLVLVSIYTAIAHKITPSSSTASKTADKCVIVSKCSRITYKGLFGYQHVPPRELVTRFHDVMGSIASFEDQQTALKLWSYYIKNVTVCGHLSPALPEFHDILQKSPTSNPTLMDSILKGNGRSGFMRQAGKLPIHGSLQRSHMLVDPTHPLSKDLKDAINAVLSNHTKEILMKLDVKEETFTYDEIDVELSMIDICNTKFPRTRDVNVTKLSVSDRVKSGCHKMSALLSVLLMTSFLCFL